MTTKQHILILPRWYPNKTDIQLGSFIQQQAILLKDEYHVHVIYVQAFKEQGQTFDIESRSNNGIDERIVYFKKAKGPLKKIINARRYKKAQKLAYILDPYTPLLCHVHVPYRSAFLALTLNKNGVPFVITEHWSGHLTGEYKQKNSADQKLYKAVLSKASGLATVSLLLQKKFQENTGFDSIVIPNLIQTVEQNDPFESEMIEILSVSDLNDEIKNITGLINSFHKALQEKTDLRLTIIGGGPDEEKIKILISELNLNNQITLKGRLEHAEVLSAYQKCHFYICNSNFETFGMTVAEALMAGKPVISTKCGGPEEFINEQNGLLINKKNNEELTKALLRMSDLYTNYDSEALSIEIGNKFGAKSIKQKLIEFYQSNKDDKSN